MSNQALVRLSPIPLLVLLAALVSTPGCATPPSGEPAVSSPPGMTQASVHSRTDGAERVFSTIEAAVRDAFEAAEREGGPDIRARLRIGTIRRVDGGFAWTHPARSSATVSATAPVQVRLRLGPQDVAIYGIHPRSGRSELDRRNETVNGHERRLVDDLDPLHRPLYVLTPSRRIVRYAHAPAALEVVSREAVQPER